jgi:NADH pyrophosphatase NudC (nudix superfamily)
MYCFYLHQNNNNMNSILRNYQNEKLNNYVEQVNRTHSRYENYTKTRWRLEDNLKKVDELFYLLGKENMDTNTIAQCAICMENLTNKTIVQTKCNHKFCYDCIEKNKKYNKNTGNLCGICRESIFN